jgi:hypothetical protein
VRRVLWLLPALVAALAALVVLTIGLFATSSAFEQPDPFEPDGEWCCVPDTWGGVAAAMAGAVLVGALVGAAGGLSAAFAARVAARRPRVMVAIAGGAAAGVILSVVTIAAAQVPDLDRARERADCDTFRLKRIEWRAESARIRLRAADGIVRCDALRGKRVSVVRPLLGAPPRRLHPSRGVLIYPAPDGHELRLVVDGERIGGASLL